MEYNIIIINAQKLVLHLQDEKTIYSENGSQMLAGLVLKPEDLETSDANIINAEQDFIDKYYDRMIDASLCFSDDIMQKILVRTGLTHLNTDSNQVYDWRADSDLMKSFNGLRFRVSEQSIIDWREGLHDDLNPTDKINTSSDLFSLIDYNPDDWECVCKVLEIL